MDKGHKTKSSQIIQNGPKIIKCKNALHNVIYKIKNGKCLNLKSKIWEMAAIEWNIIVI